MLAAAYAVPHWLQLLHTITAATGDILTPISILVGIILVVVRIGQMREEHRTQHQQVMDKLEQIQPSKGNE